MYNKEHNFSLWCDFIQREFLETQFSDLLKSGVINGATSNPAIFKTAFGSEIYKTQATTSEAKDAKGVYEILATQDIKIAACYLLQNFAAGDDGFVSIEVDPNLCHDTAGTIAEGLRLHTMIKMPNVMIKIPATPAGYEAMSELMSQGISVNATLVFTDKQAQNCLDAFKIGTQKYAKRYPKTTLPSGVISIFVSRFDRLLDSKMAERNLPTMQVGIMNATKIYHLIQAAGQQNVRALFASTGVKGGAVAGDYYIRELMFANSINTAPLDAINELIKHEARPKTPVSKQSVDEFFAKIKGEGIDFDAAAEQLLGEGLDTFVVAFDEILRELK